MSNKNSKKSKKASVNKLISKYSHRSLDAEWEKVANLCLFSFTDADGEEVFVSSEEERAYYGQGFESTFKDYPVFAPDEIVCRVAGKIGKSRSPKETLVAWIDGSYSFADQKGCCAYSVFFQVGDRIAEYANIVYDGTRRYGATASELMAAIVAIKVAVAFGYSKIDLRHDYTGVAFFSDDAQVEPNKRSKMYWIFAQYNAFLQCARSVIDISYTKVKGHSLDVGNEHADFLARTYSKRGRNKLEQHARIIENREKKSTPQIDAFAERNGLKRLTIGKVVADMEKKDFQSHFGLTEVEYTVVCKMLQETSTEDICSQTLLNRKSLAEKRRDITAKMGMAADSASDNTIVRLLLEWLYLEDEGTADKAAKKEKTDGKFESQTKTPTKDDIGDESEVRDGETDAENKHEDARESIPRKAAGTKDMTSAGRECTAKQNGALSHGKEQATSNRANPGKGGTPKRAVKKPPTRKTPTPTVRRAPKAKPGSSSPKTSTQLRRIKNGNGRN